MEEEVKTPPPNMPSPDQVALEYGPPPTKKVEAERENGNSKKKELTVYQRCEAVINDRNLPLAYVGDQLLMWTERGWYSVGSGEFWRPILKKLSRNLRDAEWIVQKNFAVPYNISSDQSASHYYLWDRTRPNNDDGDLSLLPMWEGRWRPLHEVSQETVVMSDGFYNLVTGKVTPRDPIERPIFGPVVSMSIDCIGAVHEEWQEVLDLFLPDPEHRTYIQEVFALLLLPHFSSKSFISAYGPPGSGKSTFINAVTTAPGGIVGRASCNPDLFATNQFKACSLLGKFAAVAEEFENLTLRGKNWLKAYTGGELSYEVKYGANGVATPSAKFIGVSNTLPDFLEDTRAIQDRMVLAPFHRRITGTADDLPVKQKKRDMTYWGQKDRRAAVIAWLIEGASRVARNGYKINTPTWITEEQQRVRLETHPLLAFINDTFEPGNDDDRITAADLKTMLDAQGLAYPRKQIKNLLLEVAPHVETSKRTKRDGDKWAPAAGFKGIKLRFRPPGLEEV